MYQNLIVCPPLRIRAALAHTLPILISPHTSTTSHSRSHDIQHHADLQRGKIEARAGWHIFVIMIPLMF